MTECTTPADNEPSLGASLTAITFLFPGTTSSILQSSKYTIVMAAPKMELDPKYDDYDYPTTAPNPQSGHPGHTTPQQDAQVFQLRTQLEQAGYKERLDTHTMARLHPSILTSSLGLTLHIASVPTRKEVQCPNGTANVSHFTLQKQTKRLRGCKVHRLREVA